MSSKPFIIAVSAGALFDGTDGECDLSPGLCFDIVRRIFDWSQASGLAVDVCVVSRKSPSEGGRLLRTMADHGLSRVAGCFVGPDGDVMDYVAGCGADIFLSRNMHDVQRAVDIGIPAACMHGTGVLHEGEEIRIALDGDAVLFDSATERYYQEHGMAAFFAHESANVSVPMEAGPLMPFVVRITELSKASPVPLFKIALVTARSGAACERAIRTLESFGVAVDIAVFCGDIPKLGMLSAFKPHVFFDDSDRHLVPASALMPTGKIPWKSLGPPSAA